MKIQRLLGGLLVGFVVLGFVSFSYDVASAREYTEQERQEIIRTLIERLLELQKRVLALLRAQQVTPTQSTDSSLVIENGGSRPDIAEINDFTFSGGGTFREGDSFKTLATASFEVRDADVELRRVDVDFIPRTPDVEDGPWNVFREIYIVHDGDIVGSRVTDDSDAWSDYAESDGTGVFRVRISTSNRVLEEDDNQSVRIVADFEERINGDEQEWELFIPEEQSRGFLFLEQDGVLISEGDAKNPVSVTVRDRG